MPDTSNTSAARATQVRHERQRCDTSDTSATRGKKFDFGNDKRKNMFSNPYISSMSNEELHGEEHFPSKNYLLEMSRSHAKMRLKSAP